jgi:hypothetical protein
MQIEREDLDAAVAKQILAVEQAAALWKHLEDAHPAKARFTGLNVAYYFGALVVIAAMGWLMTLGFQAMGPWAVCLIAIAYALVFIRFGNKLQADLPIPAGLLYTMAVCMTPLAVWGLERGSGFWPASDPGNYRDFFPFIRASWIWMEAATVVSALFALRQMKFSFLVAPAAVALWFMSMDLAAYLSGQGSSWNLPLARNVSLVFGLGMLFIAYLADRRTEADLSFWLYLFGMTALWGALSSMDSGSQLRRFLYCLLNIFFIVVSVALRRRVFLIYGALGVNAYLVTLAWRVFENSVLFPFALTALGLGVIWIAVKYQRNRVQIDLWLASLIPESLKAMLPHAH